MPISGEQIEVLRHLSGLENLHVYGNLLSLYSLPIKARIDEAESLYRSIRSLDDRMFSVYVSYILSRVGFSAANVFELNQDLEATHLFTTEFEDRDWFEHLDSFEHVEEGYRNEWALYFGNEKNENMLILFVTLLVSDMDGDEAKHLLGLLQKLQRDQSASGYVVVHPSLSRLAKKTFKRTKERMKQIAGQDVVLSTGQFVSKFIPQESKRKIVEANWEVLREKILGNLLKEWKILVYSVHEKQLSQIRERLRKARLKFELGLDLEESIKDAGICCEGLLQILHSIYPKKTTEKMEFYELLCSLRDEIIEGYGEDVYNDLDMIREWRNKVLHPPVTKPDFDTTLKIITKAELFHELFHNKMRQHSRHKG